MLPDIRTADVENKTVLVRLDTDVPVENGQITDDSRLKAGLATVASVLDRGGKIVILGHLGRPDGEVVSALSLAPVAKWFAEKLRVGSEKLEVIKFGDFDGWKLHENVSVLENLRFYSGEEKNDPEFAIQLAKLGQVYTNDSFAVSHREHCSVVGIATLLPHFAGVRLQEEVSVLDGLLNNPKRPMVVVIGGAKMETKLPLITTMEKIADHVLVGGKIASEYRNSDINPKVLVGTLNAEGTDVTEESIEKFLSIINSCATVVWNGPMGVINSKFKIKSSELNFDESSKGTVLLAQGIAKSSAYKVVGGGDTVEFIQRMGLTDKFDFVSTGGGAMLAFLSGENLPGLEVLRT